MPKGYYSSRRNWTEKEIEFLHEKAGRYSISELAKKLGRSENAVKLYRTRHKMPKVWDNVYTYTLLAQELNRTRRVVRKWVERGWLKGKRSTYAFTYGKRAMLFKYNDIIEFLKRYYHLFTDKPPANRYFYNIVKEQSSVAR